MATERCARPYMNPSCPRDSFPQQSVTDLSEDEAVSHHCGLAELTEQRRLSSTHQRVMAVQADISSSNVPVDFYGEANTSRRNATEPTSVHHASQNRSRHVGAGLHLHVSAGSSESEEENVNQVSSVESRPVDLTCLQERKEVSRGEATSQKDDSVKGEASQFEQITPEELNHKEGEVKDSAKMCLAGAETRDESPPQTDTLAPVVILPALENTPATPRGLEVAADEEELAKKKSRKRKAPTKKPGQTSGRWTHEEHLAFLEGLKIYGREWKKVAVKIPTRTSAQIRSHAQKYFAKMAREESLLLHDQLPPVMPSIAGPPPNPFWFAPVVPVNEPALGFQGSVERILTNPAAVQKEVEEKMRQLKARYRELQLRLLERQQEGAYRGNDIRERVVEDDEGKHRAPIRRRIDKRKRSLDEASFGSHADNDDLSTSSNASTSLATMSPTREELIALHVLGGTLPRSASNQDLQPVADGESNNGTGPADREDSQAPAEQPENDQSPP